MDQPDIDRARFNELDTEFHVAIAEAGGNRFIADLTIAVRESIRTDILSTLEESARLAGDPGGAASRSPRDPPGVGGCRRAAGRGSARGAHHRLPCADADSAVRLTVPRRGLPY